MSGLAIFGGWILFALAWTDYAPNRFFTWFEYSDIWAITDLITAGVILALAGDRWWGRVLWGLFFAQIIMHVVYQHSVLDFATYSAFLDALFLGQLSVLFMLGGNRIGDLVSHCHDYVRHVLDPPRAAQTKQEQA